MLLTAFWVLSWSGFIVVVAIGAMADLSHYREAGARMRLASEE